MRMKTRNSIDSVRVGLESVKALLVNAKSVTPSGYTQTAQAACVLTATLALGGCATFSSWFGGSSSDATEVVGTAAPSASSAGAGQTGGLYWPDPQNLSRIWTSARSTGVPQLSSTVAQIRPDVTSRNDVYAGIGFPHFDLPWGKNNEWDYAFRLDTNPDRICQYKVLYEGDRVRSTHWRDPACANSPVVAPPPPVLQPIIVVPPPAPILVQPPPPPPVVIQPPPPPPPPPEKPVVVPPPPPPPPVVVPPPPPPQPVANKVYTFSQVVTFAYNKSDRAGANPSGIVNLDQLVSMLRNYPVLEKIEVVGYADSDNRTNRNQALSQQRAETVKAYLVGKGANPGVITAVGRGTDLSTSSCGYGGRNPKVRQCKESSRRVDILVTGRDK